MEFDAITILSTVLGMIICPIIAGNKNRSIVGWFFGGLCLGIIGIIIVACLKTKKEYVYVVEKNRDDE